jgi:BRO family, N-terminal domain
MLSIPEDGRGEEFLFEGYHVRVVRGFTTEAGTVEEIGFVASDLAKALGHSTTARLIGNLERDQKGVKPFHTPGGIQSMTVISESGFYETVGRSDKPQGRRLLSFVAREVLPQLRRTGRYALPGAAADPAPAPAPLPVVPPTAAAADAARVVQIAAEILGRIPGIKPGLLGACAIASIQRSTGVDLSDLERALPAEDTLVGRLTPTEIGKILGLNSKKTNLLLAMYGFQVKNAAGKWELTDKGLEFGELVPYNNIKNQHAGYRILWNQAIVEQLPLNAQP